MFDKTRYLHKMYSKLSFCQNMDTMFRLIIQEILADNTELAIEENTGCPTTYQVKIWERKTEELLLEEINMFIDFSTMETKIKENGQSHYSRTWQGSRPRIRTLTRLLKALGNRINEISGYKTVGFDYNQCRFFYLDYWKQ